MWRITSNAVGRQTIKIGIGNLKDGNQKKYNAKTGEYLFDFYGESIVVGELGEALMALQGRDGRISYAAVETVPTKIPMKSEAKTKSGAQQSSS